MAPNTAALYNRVWKTCQDFCQEFNLGASCPLVPATVALYVAFLFNKNYSAKTIQTHLLAVSYLHKIQILQDPTKNFVVQKLVAGAHRLHPSIDFRLPITAPILVKLLHAAEMNLFGYDRVLCQAMFSFAFHTYARIGELTFSGSDQVNNILKLDDVSIIFRGKKPS